MFYSVSVPKKKPLPILQNLNNLQISELKNVEGENLSSENITFHLLIKTIKKFFNMIAYHQPDLSTNSTVYASCLLLDSVIGQLKGQLTCHACGSGQNVSYARIAVCVVVVFMKTYNRCLVSSQIVIFLLIGNSRLICSSRVLLQTELDIRNSCEKTWQNHE